MLNIFNPGTIILAWNCVSTRYSIYPPLRYSPTPIINDTYIFSIVYFLLLRNNIVHNVDARSLVVFSL